MMKLGGLETIDQLQSTLDTLQNTEFVSEDLGIHLRVVNDHAYTQTDLVTLPRLGKFKEQLVTALRRGDTFFVGKKTVIATHPALAANQFIFKDFPDLADIAFSIKLNEEKDGFVLEVPDTGQATSVLSTTVLGTPGFTVDKGQCVDYSVIKRNIIEGPFKYRAAGMSMAIQIPTGGQLDTRYYIVFEQLIDPAPDIP